MPYDSHTAVFELDDGYSTGHRGQIEAVCWSSLRSATRRRYSQATWTRQLGVDFRSQRNKQPFITILFNQVIKS